NSSQVFFEEAKNPILSIEASLPKSGKWNPLGGLLGNQYQAPVVVKKISLKEVNLFLGPYQSTIPFGPAELLSALGSSWKQALVSLQVCDDITGDGFCSNKPTDDIISAAALQFLGANIPSVLSLEVRNGRGLDIGKNPGSCEIQYSPLVLDLTGEGIQLSSV